MSDTGHKADVRVIVLSPSGAWQPLTWDQPLSPETICDWVLRVARARGVPGRQQAAYGQPPAQEFPPSLPKSEDDRWRFLESVGDWLWSHLSRETQAAIRGAPIGARLRLVVHEPPRLDRVPRPGEIPWEFLRVPGESDGDDRGRFICLDSRFSILRYARPRLKPRVPDPPVRAPLRILPVAIEPDSERSNQPSVSMHRELGRLVRQRFPGVRCEVRPHAEKGEALFEEDLAELVRLRRPSLLHLMAHGKGTQVVFADESGGEYEVAGADLGGRMPRRRGEASGLSLAALSVCGAGHTVSHSGGNTSFLVDFVYASQIPWTVGCRVQLATTSAQEFFGAFYDALREGMDVEDAVCVGRGALRQGGDQTFGSMVVYASDAYQSPVSFEAVERSPRPATRGAGGQGSTIAEHGGIRNLGAIASALYGQLVSEGHIHVPLYAVERVLAPGVDRADLRVAWSRSIASDELRAGETKEVIDDLVDRALAGGRDIVILGEPGAGKSWTLRRLAERAARTCSEMRGQPLPVLISLRGMRLSGDSPQSIPLVISRILSELAGAPVSPDQVDRLLASGSLLLLFDGLNEVAVEPGEPPNSASRGAAESLRAFAERFPRTRRVFTARGIVRDSALSLPVTVAYYLSRLSDEQVAAFVGPGRTTATTVPRSPLALSLLAVHADTHGARSEFQIFVTVQGG